MTKILPQILTQEKASSIGIGIATPKEIDEHNILNATFLAMRRAIANTGKNPSILLIDGNHKIPDCDYIQHDIIGGDDKVFSIAAASIIAKVHRDRLMCQLAQKYPQYHFEKHKGYGTKEHLEAIKKYGFSEIHRKSFLPTEVMQNNENIKDFLNEIKKCDSMPKINTITKLFEKIE